MEAPTHVYKEAKRKLGLSGKETNIAWAAMVSMLPGG